MKRLSYQMARMHKLPDQNALLDAEDQMELLNFLVNAYFSVRHPFPPKNKDNFLDRIRYPEGN